MPQQLRSALGWGERRILRYVRCCSTRENLRLHREARRLVLFTGTLQKAALCLTLIILTTRCGAFDPPGRQDGRTQVTISSGSSGSSNGSSAVLSNRSTTSTSTPASGLQLPGGITIFFLGTSGNVISQSYFIPDETAATDFLIPNGTYRVYALGYSAAGGFQGIPKCGNGIIVSSTGTVASEISLKGADTTITLNMNSSVCNNPPFSDPNYVSAATGFYPLSINICDSPLSISTASPYYCTYSRLISSTMVQGLRLDLVPFQSNADGSIPVQPLNLPAHEGSSCIAVSSSGTTLLSGTTLNGLNVPTGANPKPVFYFRMTTFVSNNCDPSTVRAIYDFRPSTSNSPTGVVLDPNGNPYPNDPTYPNSPNSDDAKLISDGSYGLSRLFLRDRGP